MKRTITLITTLFISLLMIGQTNPTQTKNGVMKKALYDKINITGDEILSHLIVNPNPTTAANLKTISSSETLIGTTTYDLQSNASVQNRIVVDRSTGSISAGWTISQEFTNVFSDRGTGYNFFDGSSWGMMPNDRIEPSRGGWPSIITLGSGKEASITHNTDNSYIHMAHRPTTGSGMWDSQILSTQDSTGIYQYMIWNRSVVGGINNNTIHMIALTAPTANAGTLHNGLDGALLYYRSQDEGITWDRRDIQLPSLDTSMFNGMTGDVYAMDAKGETVVIAYFNDWGDSFILKSDDNGDNWTRTTFLDFPVDKYTMDSGLDLDGDLEMDMVYSTDNSGTVILDANNQAHIFVGNMAYLDDDLADGLFSFFPGTNGLLYWNESMGPDLTPPVCQDSSLWYSELMPVIVQAPDLNGDSLVAGIDSTGGYALYYTSRSSMPSAGISANGEIYVSFSSYVENIDNGTQVFRHIYITKSTDGGNTWKTPVDVTPHTVWNGLQECVFGSMYKVVDDKIRIVYQKDFEPGLAVRGDEDLVDNNDIIYLEIDTVGLFDAPLSTNNLINTTNINIYPNPSTEITTIQLTSLKSQKINITITDILGKTVFSETKTINEGINIEKINITNLNTGIYSLDIHMDSNIISNKLIISK